MNTLAAGALLRDVARLHVQVQREQVACCRGTTSTQCLILTELGHGGPMTLADLARHLGLDKGWLSRAVDGLTQEGLLTKQPGELDRRTITIALSPEGETRSHLLNTTLNAQAERVLGRIPPEKRKQVFAALPLLHQALLAEAAETAERPSCEEATI
jgi:DNA-binding MarR family transcriptional regulator